MNNYSNNNSYNGSEFNSAAYPPISAAIVVLVGVILIAVITGGNALVIAAVIKDRRLQKMRQNWLIVSLAFADLLVGALIMPLSLTYEVMGVWSMGMWLCEIWLALDVLFVTSSILNLCVISLDRYFSITDPLKYPSKRTPKRMGGLVGVSWVIAFAISFPPLVGWRPKNRLPGQCTLSTDVGYVLYSASGSFYIPVTVLILVYIQIYKISKERSSQKIKEIIRKEAQLSKISEKKSPETIMRDGEPTVTIKTSPPSVHRNSQTTPTGEGQSNRTTGSDENIEEDEDEDEEFEEDESGVFTSPTQSQFGTPSHSGQSLTSNNKSHDNLSPHKNESKVVFQDKEVHLKILQPRRMKREPTRRRGRQSVFNPQKQLFIRLKHIKKQERRATIVLGLILTSFVACWFPFFVTYVLGAAGIPAPEITFDVFFWLGYCNSAVNPIIYTVFNKEFRDAFIRLLFPPQRRFGGFR